jgi:hypothetical protein
MATSVEIAGNLGLRLEPPSSNHDTELSIVEPNGLGRAVAGSFCAPTIDYDAEVFQSDLP